MSKPDDDRDRPDEGEFYLNTHDAFTSAMAETLDGFYRGGPRRRRRRGGRGPRYPFGPGDYWFGLARMSLDYYRRMLGLGAGYDYERSDEDDEDWDEDERGSRQGRILVQESIELTVVQGASSRLTTRFCVANKGNRRVPISLSTGGDMVADDGTTAPGPRVRIDDACYEIEPGGHVWVTISVPTERLSPQCWRGWITLRTPEETRVQVIIHVQSKWADPGLPPDAGRDLSRPRTQKDESSGLTRDDFVQLLDAIPIEKLQALLTEKAQKQQGKAEKDEAEKKAKK